jgi:ABC-type branched-subunit amino acid transport system ATPase component
VVEEVFQKVRAINADGVSVLMVEQKARQCLAIADVGYVLDQGHNRLTGTGNQLLANAEVIQLYLGGGRRLGIQALIRRSEADAAGTAEHGPQQP